MSDVAKFKHRFWVSPKSEIVGMTVGIQHSQYAVNWYRAKGSELSPVEASNKFLEEGWVRAQVAEDYVAMEGTEDGIARNGGMIFTFAPDFKRLILSFTDTGKFKNIFRHQVEGWSWDQIVKEARKGLIAWQKEED